MTRRMRSPLPPSTPLSGTRRPGRLSAALLATLFLAGCASGRGGPATPAPDTREAPAAPGVPEAALVRTPSGTTTADAALEPGRPALEAADTARLEGNELGTMWTFENPPRERWAARYDFRPDRAWLDHVRLASLRYGESCSSSFVSPGGLVMTNHHCARECVEAVSTEERDHVVEGFYAEEPADERVCPGLHLDQLVSIEEVTAAVRGAVPEGADAGEAARAREAARDSLAEACETADDVHCQVVSLYQGGQYQLYRYRRYEPVKLVFAPELQAGYYGGDFDNFTYPRFALDVAFVRAYRPDSVTPVRPEHWLAWDPKGAGEGEAVFVTGNPGSTSRLATVSQLQYERAFRHPFLLDFLEEQRDFLQEIARFGPEAARQVRDQLFGVENSIKAFTGELEGLRDPALMGRKIRWEREFRERVRSDSALREAYGDLWERLHGIQVGKLETRARLYLNDVDFIGAPPLAAAADLVTVLRERELPEARRPSGATDAELEELAARLRGRLPLNAEQGARVLAIRLRLVDRWLPEGDPLRGATLREGEAPGEAARRLVRSSRISDAAFRRALLEAGPAALDTVGDPLVALARTMAARVDTLRPRWEALTAEEAREEERLAEALFAVFGRDIPPDATFTLRITDGVVRRYPFNGTVAPARTTIAGLYARAADFGGEEPWQLPAAFAAARDEVERATPLNFVSTNDITGGNSGSPVVDREGRAVGVAFDGNIEQLPNEYLFRTERARTVSVHSAGITEALRSVYRAERLLEELLESGESAGSP